jgi:hypothetical protein
MASSKSGPAKSKTGSSKPKSKVSQKTEVEPKKLSKEEQLLKNIEDNETHMHEIDVIELNKETIEEAIPEDVEMEVIPESQIEIIDISEENKNSIFAESTPGKEYINEQIEEQAEDLRGKMAEVMGDRGLISREEDPSELLTGDKGQIVDEIKVAPNEEVKVYSNSPVLGPEDRDVQHAEPMSQAEVVKVKQNVYSNDAPVMASSYSEQDVEESINRLMTEKGLSYLEAKAIIYDQMRRGEFVKKVEIKKEEIVQPKIENQVQSSGAKISITPKFYKNG